MSIFEHIFLFSFLFIFYYIWGKFNFNIKNKYQFWLLALFPILLYSFIVGSRYGWGPDYFNYKNKFENTLTYPDSQIGFRWLNQGLYLLGFNYVGVYIVYSLIYIIGVFIFIRDYGKDAKYMYAFVVPFTLQFVSTFIRQGVALGFVFLALYYLNHKKWLWLILFAAISINIHSVSVIILGVICAIHFFIKKPLNWKITIPIYVFFAFVFDVNKMSFIADYVQYFSLDSHFSNYLEDGDKWFGKDAVQDQYTQSTFALVISSLFNVCVIYLGFFALKLKQKKAVIYIYNSMVVGMILLRMVFNFELLRRLAIPFEMLSFVMLGYILYVFGNSQGIIRYLKFKKRPTLLYYFMIFCISVYLLMFYGRFIFLNPQAMFFWNK